MRRLAVPLSAAAGLLVVPAVAAAGSGGAQYGVRPVAMRVAAFSVSPGELVPGGAPAVVSLRISGPGRRVRVRVAFVPAGGRRSAAVVQLGWQPTGVAISRSWPVAGLAAGSYVARVHAVDAAGRTLRRTATASGKQPVTVSVAPALLVAGVFPVAGPGWSFGGDDARFGARRDGHVHQGQDLTAPEGTPVRSPRAGTVFWRAIQKGGAGRYLVIRGYDGRDYVFMHLVARSETVATGEAVASGQVIGAVGSTGDADGPHLHFEIWPDGWHATESEPIDPRPELEAWAAAAA